MDDGMSGRDGSAVSGGGTVRGGKGFRVFLRTPWLPRNTEGTGGFTKDARAATRFHALSENVIRRYFR
jgi:hypothetical protein